MEPESDYDLLKVVIIRRGNKAGAEELFDYLYGLFNHDIGKIGEYVDISNDEGLIKEVHSMSGLGQSIYDKGMQQGEQKGRVEERVAILNNMLKNGITFETAVKLADIPAVELDEYRRKLSIL